MSNCEIVLQGVHNFRELGGYVTADNRRVVPGRIYRCGYLIHATDADLEEFDRRKIHTVIDFCDETETTAASDRLLPSMNYISLRIDRGTAVFKTLAKGQSGSDAMRAYYSDIFCNYKESYRLFFQELLRLPDTSALAFHCAAGKDRTGIAAALLLHILGVPSETIMADYVATSKYLGRHIEKVIDRIMEIFSIGHKDAAEVLDAHPSYLETYLNAAQNTYGSLDAFLHKELGIDAPAKQKLREMFLIS